MCRRFAFPEKLRLGLIFGIMIAVGFLAFKNMNLSSAINSAYNGFSAGNIISDYVMSDYTSMSEAEIQAFLKSKNPCNDTNIVKASWYPNLAYHIENGHFVCMADERFNGESASHIIWQAAQDYRINPKVLIVLLEKEQGLVTDTWPNSTLQYRSATGYGCPDTAACDSQYYGFKNQVRNAAELFRYILDHGSRYYPVGNNYVKYNPDGNCGGSTVNIENRATSALYQYTPYQPNASVLNSNPGTVVHCGAYGNSNFYFYYTRWFGDTHGKELQGVYLPDGIYQLKTNDGLALSFADVNNGSSAIVVDNNTGDDLQKFKLIRDGKYYRLQNVKTGKFLDVFNNESEDGTKVELWDSNSDRAQKWLILNSGSSYRLVTACSSEAATKSLDVNGGSTGTVGAEVKIWSSNDSTAQQWNFVNLSPAPIVTGEYSIKASSGKVLTAVSENPVNEERMIIWEDSTSINNRYDVTRLSEGYYTIKNKKIGYLLAVKDASLNNGANAVLARENMSDCNEKWIIEKNNSDYRIINSCSGKSLDIEQSNIYQNGSRVQIWASNSSEAQRWLLTEPNNSQPVPDGEYVLESGLGNRLRLDVVGSSAIGNGTNVDIWSRNGGDNQKFILAYNGDTGYYSISINTGHYLDTTAAGSNGANVQVYQKGNGCFQQWLLIPTDDKYHIISVCERNALDVYGANSSNGANVVVWGLNGGINQKWYIKPASSDLNAPLANGNYTITSRINNNLSIDILGGSKNNGANVAVWGSNGGNNQKFRITYDAGDGYYSIYNEWSGKNLDATGAVARNGTNLEIWSSNSSCAQKWDISKTDGDYYRIASACNIGYSLDIDSAKNENGANILLWANHGNANQQWLFTRQ